MESSFITVLESSLDPESKYFMEAQRKLQLAKESNLPEFINALSEVIANHEAGSGPRYLAGILLKNCFEFKTEEEKMNFYKNTSADVLYYLKVRMINVMKTGAESQAVLAACTVVARIAQIELSTKSWPEFFDIILTMVDSNDFNQTRSSLICLSYLIEDLSNIYENQNVNLLSDLEVNRLLTSVIKGVYIEDPQSCKMALRSLQNLLFFIENNMEVDAERDVIVEAICRRCSENNDLEIRTAAFDCLVQLVSEYYSRLIPSLQVIVPFLWQAIDSHVEQIAIPAFEFWNTICEIEIQSAANATDRTSSTVRSESTGKSNRDAVEGSIIKQVIPYLLPKILFTMTLHKFEDMDVDTWTLPMAAGICLSLCSQTVKNDIVHSVLEFVTENFKSTEWNKREAAVLAYGYIMEGPDSETLKILVSESFDNLCDVLSDTSIAVRDTAAWTIGRIATFHCEVVLNHLGSPDVPNSNLSKIVRALFDVPRVAVNICYFINELAEHINDYNKGPTNLLDCMFARLCEMLVNRSTMADTLDRNLYVSIYSSLCALIAGVSNNCLTELMALLDHFVVLVSQMITSDFSYEQKLKIQSVLGAIQVLVSRVGFVKNLNLLMNSIFEFLSVELDEEALLTLSALVNVIEFAQILPFIPKIVDVVLTGLQSEVGICKISIGLTSDVSRCLESPFSTYLDRFMTILINILQDVNGDKTLKPLIIVAIGDIAMAVGGTFSSYVQNTMTLLLQAATTTYEMGPIDNEDWIYFVNQLQESSLQCFTGIVYGLKEGGALHLLRPYVSSLLQFAQQVVETPDPFFDTNLYKLAVSLIGDLSSSFGSDLSRHLVDSNLIRGIESRLKQLELAQDPGIKDCRDRVGWLHSTLAIN
ncbi:HEAT repeat family protein [Theileria parva strain Muguga]|uniref:Importin beta, putative n=1 Tax=Theileria parva TaxID=5875 RepID=Q4N9P2_THEPA|nr:HEAT repeat family protein [Theileria parva strain Muguga]EAN33316.1 HEAT repeat family protein [Theileria parva strain Muguga]|eukprot:XP_765599.1 importin beta [Theileria parva strain Muguga]